MKESLEWMSDWEKVVCLENDCFICTTNPNNRNSCRKPMGYTISCTLCAEGNILAQYEGETGGCLNKRGLEHIDALQTDKKSNCQVIHNAAHHSGSKELNFIMKATSLCIAR